MALLRCFECGAKVSDTAQCCPKCGGIPPKSKVGTTVTDKEFRQMPRKERKAFKHNGGKVDLPKGRIIFVIICLFIIYAMVSGK